MMCSFLVVSIHIFLSLTKYSNAQDLDAPCVLGEFLYTEFFLLISVSPL